MLARRGWVGSGRLLETPKLDGVKRSLLTPRWLLVHLLFVAAVVATGFLTVWQWDRAHEAGGTFQNLGYSLQWPLFGGFTLFLWYRVIQMRLEHASGDIAEADAERSTGVNSETSVTGRPLVPPPAPAVREDEDPELAAYNQYLAELNDADRAS